MVDYGTIFLLVLAALTFIIIGMFFIVYLMVIGEREKNKLRAMVRSTTAMETTQVCPHFLGYLAGYPINQPISDECFGCTKAMECMNAQRETENTIEVAEPPEQQ